MAGAGLWDWLRGYVIIRIEGRAPERFVNMAAAYRIELADVTMLGPGMMLVRTSVDGYRQLGPVLRASGCRAAIEERMGAAFIVARLLRRRFLVLGAVLFLAVLYSSSSVLWTIEVVGAEQPEREQSENDGQDLLLKAPARAGDVEELRGHLRTTNRRPSQVVASPSGSVRMTKPRATVRKIAKMRSGLFSIIVAMR